LSVAGKYVLLGVILAMEDIMKYIMLLFIVCSGAFAADGIRIYQTDKYGIPQKGQPGFIVEGNRIYQTDKYGTPLVGQPGYVIKGDKLYHTDKYGIPLYGKPAKEISHE